MPEHLKALVVILILASLVFAFARKPALAFVERVDYDRRRNLWFGLTMVAFLAYSYWIYAFVATVLLVFAMRRDTNKVALYLVLLLVMPATSAQIPGFGLINYMFELNHVRLLGLVILLPMFVRLAQRSDAVPFGRLATDKLLAAYLLLSIILQLRETTVTDTLRYGFYVFIDVFLPYFVISRGLKSLRDHREAMLGLVMASMVLASICIFEAVYHWQLYRGVSDVLGVPMDSLSYIERNGILRATGTAGHPIAAGYVMAIALAFYLFLKDSIASRLSQRLGLALLLAGLIAPLSRGPWVGAAAMIMVFLATGPQPLKRLGALALAGLIALPLVALLPGGRAVIDLLPFIGSVEKGTIDYRAQLLDNAYAVIMRNPWFGSVDFAMSPELQAMIQGQGIIDVVNTYLLISLEYGFVGLALFVGFLALVAWNIFQGFRGLQQKNGELHALGRSLLAALATVLVIISTVSSVGHIPVIMWSVAGMGVAYGLMLKSTEHMPVP